VAWKHRARIERRDFPKIELSLQLGKKPKEATAPRLWAIAFFGISKANLRLSK